MIAFIEGIVEYKDAEKAILQAGGIGYELSMSIHALAGLPSIGSKARVWTHMHVKDDGISLFGFSDPSEKQLFCQLIGVSGIGPKMALSALSTFKPTELVGAISASDVTAVSSVPGIGKKTAQRMILELQGALGADASLQSLDLEQAASQPMKDASRALESMGFKPEEVSTALKGCDESSVSGIIRYALKHMGGAA